MSIPGGAAEVIITTADNADMVVMGSRGLGGFKGMLLGSVTDQVSRHAPCPVVVLPPTSREEVWVSRRRCRPSGPR
jgi:nucleotide-binding universal stress UspA family protein